MVALVGPLAPLVALAAITAIALSHSSGVGITPSTGTETILGVGWAFMLVLWMDADARKLRRLPCYDFGWLAAIYFPVSLLWYCFWSRGWRGALLLLMLLALWLVPYIIATLFAIVQHVRG